MHSPPAGGACAQTGPRARVRARGAGTGSVRLPCNILAARAREGLRRRQGGRSWLESGGGGAEGARRGALGVGGARKPVACAVPPVRWVRAAGPTVEGSMSVAGLKKQFYKASQVSGGRGGAGWGGVCVRRAPGPDCSEGGQAMPGLALTREGTGGSEGAILARVPRREGTA